MILFILTTTLVFQTSYSARILAVFPMPSISHQIVYDSVMVALANHGHEIVTITPYPMKTPPRNLTQISVHFAAKAWRKKVNYALVGSVRPSFFYHYFKTTFPEITELQLQSPEVARILQDKNETFDLIFISAVYDQAVGFIHRFKGVPVIGMASLPTHYNAIGAPTHPVLYTEFVRKYLYDLSLLQRIETLFDYLYVRYVDWICSYSDDRLMRKYFGEDMPSVRELRTQMDMLFLSANPLLVGIRPEVPAIVRIDGIHLKPKQSLPQDILDFLDSSPNGVIYMSLGSNVHSKDLGNETLKIIKEAFSELPYKILWKFESESLPGKPDNVFIKQWMPQQDILGHKNVKAFIFQGGQQSFEEAMRDKVPLVCIPFAVDQHINAQRIVNRKLGLSLDIKTVTKKLFKEVVTTVASDPIYKAAVTELSGLMADTPMTSLERAIWWTDYVLRHRGAKHLKAPATDISYAEYFMLDVIAVLIIAAIICTGLTIALFYNLSRIIKRPKLLKLKKD